MARALIYHLCRLGLGAVFLTAGILKIWDFSHHASATLDFYQDILNYQVNFDFTVLGFRANSSDAAMVLAIYLPWLEVVAGVALLLRRAAGGAAFLAALMMLVFIAALASAWARGLDISCGCFGHENATANFPLLLLRDLALLAAALFLAWQERPGVLTASRPPA